MVRLVCISDTHNDHRSVRVPDGDVLIHAGDFTNYGKVEHAEDFNAWLGELPHTHKILIVGNHENNAPWHKQINQVISNATVLRQSGTTACGLSFFGTDFFWPCQSNPYYDQIPEDTNVILTHGPVKGFVDGGLGCVSMRNKVSQIGPCVVVSGHIHSAYGVAQNDRTTFVNAALCDDRRVRKEPVVLDVNGSAESGWSVEIREVEPKRELY
eukprot:c10227_g1_i1.p1 GENE.c10227_g1_i1~~c10227_g1_i1.p1  ORF type:complete len:212 (+),score=36.21 c10227_g1_i1:74-709(+)